MKLLVDVGNSCIKWAYQDGHELCDHGFIMHGGYKLDEVLGAAWRKLPKPSQVIVANVAGPMANHVLNQLSQQYFGLMPTYMISSAKAGGVTSGYRDPARLGVDRWAALIGAFNRHGAPACVIDCGTAITLDAITRDGRHLGGLIAPGIHLMRHALVGATAGITDEEDDEDSGVFAQDTHAAVAGGALNAAVGLIARVSAQMLAELGNEAKRLITGGDAERLLTHLQEGYTLVPHLVLEGLSVMADVKE
ncbi:MAG: type III pantothenate kinase [Gammaproteobacteria bacterium]